MSEIHKTGDLILNRYEIINFLAQGGMQQVYLTWDRNIERSVALKTPKNDSAIKRFNRSAIVSARVIHPNVARTLDYFQFNGREYLIEEYIEGRDLSDIFISHFYYLDPCSVAHIGHLLARAISASHRVGVIHRDLKPSNVMVKGGISFSEIKVTDFGIAKMVDDELVLFSEDDAESSIAGSQTLVGAMPYMAPEVVLNQAKVGKYSDIWSIGAMLYHLLAGSTPYSAQFSKIVIHYHKQDRLDDIKHFSTLKHLSHLADQLKLIIDRCMSFNIADRPDADELVAEFSNLCYPTTKRSIGSVYRRRGDAGWGFIHDVETNGDVFFHCDEVYGDLPIVSETVTYSYYPGDPKPRAFPIIKSRP